MHIFGTRLMTLGLASETEKLKDSRLRQPSIQDLAHVTNAKTKFYKKQKKMKYYGLRKKIELPLTGNFTAKLYLDLKF